MSNIMPDQSGKYMEQDGISLRELIERIRGLAAYLLSKWAIVAACVLVGGVLGYLYTLGKPTYTAETTFALEESGGLGQLSGLASSIGLNIGGLGGQENSLFAGENILELYKSKRMLKETLLTEIDYKGTNERLIYTFARETKLDTKWKRKENLKNISFDIEPDKFTILHDSLLIHMVKLLQEKYVAVAKPSRRLNIVNVSVNAKDPVFAREFNTTLVKKVNEFYYKTKTKKTAETIEMLQHQADSIKRELDGSMFEIAESQERTLNLNVLNKTQSVPIQRKQIDMQSSYIAYVEVVKSLELVKLSHLEKQPLIQIIDRPGKYLLNDKWKWYKGVVYGAFMAGALVFFGLAAGYILKMILKEA